MHKVWLDTNILVDYLVRRKPFESFALDLFYKIENQEIVASTSVINLIHAHYQLRKTANESTSREMLNLVIDLLRVQEVPEELSLRAISNTLIKDFEDAVQYELALLSKSDFFITRNIKDFPISAPFIICDAETYPNKFSLKE